MLVLGLASFASMASLRACDSILPLLALEFSTTTGVAAQTISAFAVAYGVLQIFYGPMGDLFGRARLMAWATVCCAGANLALASSPSLGGVIGWRLLAGAASGGIVPLSLALIGDAVAYERRQVMLTRLMIATILGMISGQWLGGLVADALGWRVVFYGLAGLFGMAAWALFHVAAADRRSRVAVQQPSGEGAREAPGVRVLAGRPAAVARWPGFQEGFALPIGRVLRVPWARRVLVVVLAEGAFAFAAFSFVPSFLHDRFGLSLGQAGAVMALYGLGGLWFAAVARRAIARLGERGLVLAGGAALGLAMALLTAAPRWQWAVPACLVGGLGFYMLHSTLQTHATQMAPEARGTAVSLFVVFLFFGQSLGVVAASLAVDHASVRWVFAASALALPTAAWWFAAQLARRARAVTEP
jgi:predicted MFS family arabinose efflux permease